MTGRTGSSPHLGNTWVSDPGKRPPLVRRHLHSLVAQFDTSKYLTKYSDIVALLVFEHQMRVTNLLTRLALDVRFTEYAKATKDTRLPLPGNANDLVRDGVNGLVGVDITPEIAARIAMAYGTTMPVGTRVVASRDAHPASRMINRAIVAGLVSTGIAVSRLRCP